MFLNFAGWTSDILPNENVAIAGTTYDIEAINAVDFLMKEKGVKSGDAVGHLYFEGDYGENALAGSKFAAGEHDLKIVEQKITPADTDMTGQVAAFRRAGVKAILFWAAPPQAASLAGVAASQKLDVPIVANGPGWTPQLLTTPAAKALAANYYVVSSMAPLSVQGDGVQEFLIGYEAKYPKGTPSSNGSLYAYAGAQIADAALTKACENKDLTRKGVLDALRSLTRSTRAAPWPARSTSPTPRRLREARVLREGEQGRAGRAGVAGRAGAGADAEGYEFVMPTLAELPGLAGQRLGPTEWREMTQERVNEFADVTEDHNYIHVDPERAKDSPFGGTIAHGYLSVALLAPISKELLDVRRGDRRQLRHGQAALPGATAGRGGVPRRGGGARGDGDQGRMQVKVTITLEVRDQERPALVAECLFRYYA